MEQFQDYGDIILEAGDLAVPFTFTFTTCSSATANDGYIPYGDSISDGTGSITLTAYDSAGTDRTSDLISGSPTFTSNVLTVQMQYPTASDDDVAAGKYHLKMIVVTANSVTFDADFNRIIAEDTDGFFNIFDLRREISIESIDQQQRSSLYYIIKGVLNAWDRDTRRTWASTTHTEIHSSKDGLSPLLFLKNYPITTLTSVKIDYDRSFGSSITAESTDSYTHDPDTGIIYRNANYGKGIRHIQVIYVAGYTNLNFPEALKRVLIRQTAVLMKQAQDKSWHISSRSQPGGATTSFSGLRGGWTREYRDAIVSNSVGVT